MADKKLNAVSTASDGAYIYAEDASGNQIKISKADLATVVAEIIGFNNLHQFVPRDAISSGTNLDGIKSQGIYRVSGAVTQDNAPGAYGVLSVMAFNVATVVQLFASNGGTSFIRVYWSDGWSDWKGI